MVDFKATHDADGWINFCNEYGGVVKQYRMTDLECYVDTKHLNLSYETIEDEQGEPKEVEVYQPINEYIDNNWFEVTEQFYIANNPTEHVAKHNYAYSKEANL